MSIDSINSKASQEKEIEESENEISEISDDHESMEIEEQNENINKRSRIAQANKDIEAMNISDKVYIIYKKIKSNFISNQKNYLFIIRSNNL